MIGEWPLWVPVDVLDLLACPSCNERFVVREALPETGWTCLNCHAELRVIGHRIPESSVAAEGIDTGDHLRRVRVSARAPIGSA